MIIALAFASINSLDCWAEPSSKPSPNNCVAGEKIQGAKGWYVSYHITVPPGSAPVYCKGIGVAVYGVPGNCNWQMWPLGQIGEQYVTVIWDNANWTPEINCVALGDKPVKLTWTFSTGTSTVSCLHRAAFDY